MATRGPVPSPASIRRPLAVSIASDPMRIKFRMKLSNSFSIRAPQSSGRNSSTDPEFAKDDGQASRQL
jgi:hypothetical protein